MRFDSRSRLISLHDGGDSLDGERHNPVSRKSNESIDVQRLQDLLQDLRNIINPGSSVWSEEANVAWLSKLFTNAVIGQELDSTLELARDLYRIRRERDKYFPGEIFADPAWDILLELYVAQYESRRSSVKTVCLASGVPATTALRWITILEKAGLIVRKKDENDSRVRCIALSEDGHKSMRTFLQGLLERSGEQHRGKNSANGALPFEEVIK